MLYYKILKTYFFQLIILILIPVYSHATEVTWGGVAFVDNKNTGTLYKNLSNIGIEKLDKWANEAIKPGGTIRKFNNFTIKVINKANRY